MNKTNRWCGALALTLCVPFAHAQTGQPAADSRAAQEARATREAVRLRYVHAWLAERGTGRGNARLHTVSGFYELPWGRGLTASLGWSHLRDGDDSSDGFGAQIAFSFPQPEPEEGW